MNGKIELVEIEKCIDIVVSEVVDVDMVSVATDVCLLLSSTPSSAPPAVVMTLAVGVAIGLVIVVKRGLDC